jgi:HTH-type transcriptional regulator/antitoxin HigA
MIKSAKQLAITREQLEKFQATLEQLNASGRRDILANAERAGVESVIQDLQAEIQQYQFWTSERGAEAASRYGLAARLSDLPHQLINHRLAAGLTQEGLAELVGKHTQQIQRYEATDYAGASLETLLCIALALAEAVKSRCEALRQQQPIIQGSEKP